MKHNSIRFIISLLAKFGVELEQMDVKTTLLHNSLYEKMVMKHPESFEVGNSEDKNCLAKKLIMD